MTYALAYERNWFGSSGDDSCQNGAYPNVHDAYFQEWNWMYNDVMARDDWQKEGETNFDQKYASGEIQSALESSKEAWNQCDTEGRVEAGRIFGNMIKLIWPAAEPKML